jgi:hypothetical protein
MGRPPAKWMYEASNSKGVFEPFYSFRELAEMFSTSYLSVKKFCSSHKIKGKYIASGQGPAIRLVSFKDFQKKTREYVISYCR